MEGLIYSAWCLMKCLNGEVSNDRRLVIQNFAAYQFGGNQIAD